MKKYLLLIISILLVMSTTGCSSYTELNDLGIVSLLGIDYKNNNYQVYVTIMKGKQNDGTLEKEQTYLYTEAKTIEEAFKKITLQSDKKIYLSHVDTLLLTKNLIDNHLKDIIHNFLNNNESRNNFYLVLLKDDIKTYFDKEITAEEINKLVEINHKESGTISEIDFESFLRNLLIDNNTTIPTISYTDNHLNVEGITLIKNYKVFDTLGIEDSILLNLMNNQVKNATIEDIRIYDNETTIKTNKNKVTISLNITTDNKDKLNTILKESCKKLLIYYQEQNYDLLKVSNKIKQNDFLYYKDTKDLLTKIQFKIKAKIKNKEKYIEEE